jgi:hypothetical protein
VFVTIEQETTRLPVRSALFKQRTGGPVVRWVTTGESPLLYVFAIFDGFSFLLPSSVLQFFATLHGLGRERGGHEYRATNVPFLACQPVRKSPSPFKSHLPTSCSAFIPAPAVGKTGIGGGTSVVTFLPEAE